MSSPDLFGSHSRLAKTYWSLLLRPGDQALDATIGNGRDVLTLAELCLHPEDFKGYIWGMDIQREAIESTTRHLESRLAKCQLERISLSLQSHEEPPAAIKKGSLKLAVYNLGYLPGGKREVMTREETTLKSLTTVLPLIANGGAISIMCYPGHSGGDIEEQAVVGWAKNLSRKEWSCCWHTFPNRRLSPSLLIVQRVGFMDFTEMGEPMTAS